MPAGRRKRRSARASRARNRLPHASEAPPLAMRAWLERAGFDPRFTSLVLALALVWIALAVATDGLFLSPRNIYNLSIQTCVTAIMACGMVYLIVARQIDLSVGSQMAFTGMVIAFVQVEWLGAETPSAWVVSIVLGVAA